MHNSLAIANHFIDLGDQKLTLMQLLKLSYIAHGFNMAILNKELSKELVQAWKFGPVFPSMYHGFKSQGSGPIKNYAETLSLNETLIPIRSEFNSNETKVMQIVYDAYGSLNGLELSALTHETGTPWYKTWHEEGGSEYDGVTIDNEKIKEHFKTAVIEKYVTIKNQ